MAAKEVNEIMAWIGENHASLTFTLTEVKELLEIERMPEPATLGPWAENLTQSMIDEYIADQKASGEYLRLANKVESFKEKLSAKFK